MQQNIHEMLLGPTIEHTIGQAIEPALEPALGQAIGQAIEPTLEPALGQAIEPALEQFTELWDAIRANEYPRSMPVIKIDNINVFITCQKFREQIQITIVSDWGHHYLFLETLGNPTELMVFTTNTIINLKFHSETNSLRVSPPESCTQKLWYKCLPKHNNIVTQIEECCVCFEICRTKTQCNHPLCLSCESKIQHKVCPICRTHYAVERDEDED